MKRKLLYSIAGTLFVLFLAVGLLVGNNQSANAEESNFGISLNLSENFLMQVLDKYLGENEDPAIPEGIGGKTRLNEVNVSWIELGEKVSSTTDPIYKFSVTEKISGSENEEAFENTQLDTDGVQMGLMVTKVSAYFAGNASTTYRFDAATTTNTTVGAANYYTSPISGGNLLHQLVATSTGGNMMLTATTTEHGARSYVSNGGSFYLPYGESINFLLVAGSSLENNPDHCGTGGTGTKCESATSTNTGVKPITYIVEGFATSTPKISRNDTQ